MIRLYGMRKGNGSWARVTAGWKMGLEHLGVLTDVYYLDDPPEGVPDGFDAPVAVYVGPPTMWGVMEREGRHASAHVVLAPNSTWIPRELLLKLDEISDSGGGCLPPSAWAYDMLRRAGYRGTMRVVPHGVDATEYQKFPRAPARDPKGPFNVVHFSSSARERKGTDLLKRAWYAIRSNLPDGSELVLVQDYLEGVTGEHRVRELSRLNVGFDGLHGFLQNFSIVCQPSRAEGFGLVPLEAAAFGVPSVLTHATGHLEYCDAIWEMSVQVAAEPYGPIDDGPDAQAPMVKYGDVASAIVTAYRNFRQMSERARFEAPVIRESYNWPRVILASGFIEYARGFA